MNNKEKSLKEFVEGMEMTILSEEDSVLLDGLVGTSGTQNLCNSDYNCNTGCGSNNCQGGNCVAGCGSSN